MKATNGFSVPHRKAEKIGTANLFAGSNFALLIGLILFSLPPFAEAREIEIQTKDWFSAPPFSMKCVKAEDRIISEQYDKKFVDLVLLIKNQSEKKLKLSGTENYSFYLQDTAGRIHPAEFFGKKAALYQYDKGHTMIDKELLPQETVKARITFLTPADSLPGKLLIRSLKQEGPLVEVKFAEVVGETELFVPEHTLTPQEPAAKEKTEKQFGFTVGGKFSLFNSKAKTTTLMLGLALYQPLADIGLARIALDSASYDDPAGKLTIIPLSLVLNREIFSFESFKFYAGLGAAYTIAQSSIQSLAENSVGLIIAAGAKKELKENLLGNLEIQSISGQGTSLGLEMALSL